jgi:hypothetical protein
MWVQCSYGAIFSHVVTLLGLMPTLIVGPAFFLASLSHCGGPNKALSTVVMCNTPVLRNALHDNHIAWHFISS